MKVLKTGKTPGALNFIMKSALIVGTGSTALSVCLLFQRFMKQWPK